MAKNTDRRHLRKLAFMGTQQLELPFLPPRTPTRFDVDEARAAPRETTKGLARTTPPAGARKIQIA